MEDLRISVLFVCVGNMCRSPLAEAFARHHAGDRLTIGSAGLAATGEVHPVVLEILEDRGVSSEGLTSTPLQAVDFPHWDWVVSMAGIRAEGFVPEDYAGRTRFWPIEDPMGKSREVFEEVADDVEAHVIGFLKEIGLVDEHEKMSAGWVAFDEAMADSEEDGS